jgi:transmembrane 9 superfamily protein 2/4
MLALFSLWFGVSIPLVLCGMYFGYRTAPLDFPVSINTIPRQIPPQLWCVSVVKHLQGELT